jgi:hypothetical protein
MNLRDYERESIRRFVQRAADDGYLAGEVIDVGSGQQPYRDIVLEVPASYTPFDAPGYPGSTVTQDTTGAAFGNVFDSILCTQVIQYQERPEQFLLSLRERFRRAAALGAPRPDCYLVMTYPTNWPEVEVEDRHRFTKAGMEELLTEAGFSILRHEKRGSVWDPRFDVGSNKRVTATGEELVLGYGVVARA